MSEAGQEQGGVNFDLETIAGYLSQIEEWQDQEIEVARDGSGRLPENWGSLVLSGLTARAENENPTLVPLIKAKFSSDPESVPLDVITERVGAPIEGDDVLVSGHISESTLWLYDERGDTIQTMVRLLVGDGAKSRVVDVYSDPVSPLYTPTKHGEGMGFNIVGTEPSRARNVLSLVAETPGASIEGWVNISEVNEHRAPVYTEVE